MPFQRLPTARCWVCRPLHKCRRPRRDLDPSPSRLTLAWIGQTARCNRQYPSIGSEPVLIPWLLPAIFLRILLVLIATASPHRGRTRSSLEVACCGVPVFYFSCIDLTIYVATFPLVTFLSPPSRSRSSDFFLTTSSGLFMLCAVYHRPVRHPSFTSPLHNVSMVHLVLCGTARRTSARRRLEAPLVAGNFGLNKGLIKEVRRYESFTVTVSTPPCTPFMIAFSLSHTNT